jgi:cytochrome c553
MMSMQAKDLTDQQIADLAAYFGSRNSQLINLSGSHKK